jgi:soluble lytic murein transglycosylase-like protein
MNSFSISSTAQSLALVLSASLFASTAAADVYKYVDKFGHIHLSDRALHDGYRAIVRTWKGWQFRPEPRVSGINRKKFQELIAIVANRYELDSDLVHAVVRAESAYNPNAISRAGAVGLMQLMPQTAKAYGVTNRRDPAQNLQAGTRYLRYLLGLFKNDLSLALAAYNAGEGTVKRYGNRIPPYKETQNYVRKVLAFYQQARGQRS